MSQSKALLCPQCQSRNKAIWQYEDDTTEIYTCSEGHQFTKREAREAMQN